MTVATALAVSWKPFTNSKLSASPKASTTKNRVEVLIASPNRCTSGLLSHSTLKSWFLRSADLNGQTNTRRPQSVRRQIAFSQGSFDSVLGITLQRDD